MTKEDLERGLLTVTFDKDNPHDVCGELKGKILLYNRVTDSAFSVSDNFLNTYVESITQQASLEDIKFSAETAKVGQVWSAITSDITYTIKAISDDKNNSYCISSKRTVNWSNFYHGADFIGKLIKDVT